MQVLNGRGDKRTAKGKRFSRSNGKVILFLCPSTLPSSSRNKKLVCKSGIHNHQAEACNDLIRDSHIKCCFVVQSRPRDGRKADTLLDGFNSPHGQVTLMDVVSQISLL